MSRGLYQSVEAMSAAERRLEAITANLANLDTNGYKRTSATTQGFDVVLRGRLERQVATRTTQDFSQGELRNTGNPFDLALVGAGFFTVETPNGEAFTRNGQFHVNDQGVLQTLEGCPVAWDGARGTLDPNGAEPTVDASGEVRQGENVIGRLALADFDRPAALGRDRLGFYRADSGLRSREPRAEVRQFHLERANVSAIDEMVALIAVQRSFESATKLLSSIDQSYRRLTTPR